MIDSAWDNSATLKKIFCDFDNPSFGVLVYLEAFFRLVFSCKITNSVNMFIVIIPGFNFYG